MSKSDNCILITFDVDGTLMHSVGLEANKLHKKAFAHAFKTVFGIDGTIDAIKHHGSTDKMVAVRTLEHYGVPEEQSSAKLPEISESMLEYAREHADEIGDGLEVLPGVADLMSALAGAPQVVVGLVTGNLEEIAWMKMKALGLLPYFSVPNFGGFGSDHIERGELVKIAANRAQQNLPDVHFIRRIHVGDTPMDVKAAEFGGAMPVGVCTGVFTREELAAVALSDSAVILDSLVDTNLFLKACGITTE